MSAREREEEEERGMERDSESINNIPKCGTQAYYNNIIISESNFLLWNTPGSDDAVTVALG